MRNQKEYPLSVSYICLSVVIILGMLAYAKPGRVLNEIFLLVSLSFVLDIVYFFIISHYIKIKLDGIRVVKKGEQAEVILEVTNTSFLTSPFIYIRPKEGIRLRIKEETSIGTLLGKEEQVSRTITYDAEFAGIEKIKFEQVILKSYIGLIKKRIEIPGEIKLRILPEIRKLRQMKCLDDSFKEKNRQGTGDNQGQVLTGTEIGYELRPYMEGDSQKLIHWKLAAFRDEYFVRQLEGERVQKSSLIFILSPFMNKINFEDEVSRQDKILTTFISLIAYYFHKGEAVKAVCYREKEWRVMDIKTSSQLRKLQEELCSYEENMLEDIINHKSVITSLWSKIGVGQSNRVWVTGCWNDKVESYILNSMANAGKFSVVWCESRFPSKELEWSQLSLWHMTDEYELKLMHQKR